MFTVYGIKKYYLEKKGEGQKYPILYNPEERVNLLHNTYISSEG